MKSSMIFFGLVIVGCGQTKESINTVDSSVPDVVELPQGLNGTEPAQETPPPVFSAFNYDGSSRNQDNLIGHPTVLWFFPFAGTPG